RQLDFGLEHHFFSATNFKTSESPGTLTTIAETGKGFSQTATKSRLDPGKMYTGISDRSALCRISSRSASRQFLARIIIFARAKPVLTTASLLPNPTLPVFTAIRICLLISTNALFSSLTRHHHGHLYQTSAHGYLLTDNHVLRHPTQRISNTFDRSIHNRRDCDLERCLCKSARLLTTDSVTSHLQHVTGRGHHICHEHHMPAINV